MNHLKPISKHLSKNNLWDRNLRSFSPEEMTELRKAITESYEDYRPPYLKKITRNGKVEYDLVIPDNVAPIYRPQENGQSYAVTVAVLGGDLATIEKYSHSGVIKK